MAVYTSMRVSVATKRLLDKARVHERQSYDEIIRYLAEYREKKIELEEKYETKEIREENE